MTAQASITADFAPGRPVPFEAILGVYQHGSGDPTYHSAPGVVWRTARTPDGPVTLRLHREPATSGDRVVAHAWGPGAQWTLDGLPELLGDTDELQTFRIHHETLHRVARTHQHWRVARSRLILDSLIPAIIEQRVTGKQAFGAYRQLVRRHGAPAPGPAETIAKLRLMVPPDVAGWRRIPSWEWLRTGVDGRRADTVQRVLQVAPRLAECADLPREKAWQRLRSVPGIGVWTAAETMQRAAGDADAVSFGDYHVAKDIGHALTGAPVDDQGLATLLEPYAGHRYRVQYLVTAGRLGAPRRGPRLAVPTHLPG
ncbi:DNA-3-methyladenine glycosylase family protein [Flexivirga sp. B27]